MSNHGSSCDSKDSSRSRSTRSGVIVSLLSSASAGSYEAVLLGKQLGTRAGVQCCIYCSCLQPTPYMYAVLSLIMLPVVVCCPVALSLTLHTPHSAQGLSSWHNQGAWWGGVCALHPRHIQCRGC